MIIRINHQDHLNRPQKCKNSDLKKQAYGKNKK